MGTSDGGHRTGNVGRWQAGGAQPSIAHSWQVGIADASRRSPVTLYLDSSALLKLYVKETGSEDVATLVQDANVVATSALAYAEVRATLGRLRREHSLTPTTLARAKQQFESDWGTMLVLNCDHAIAIRAGGLAEQHALRGADAVHLAAFERLLTMVEDDDVHFSCADQRLNKAARQLG